MDKEPNINIWEEISVNELVPGAAKVEQKYEKQQEKRRFVKNKWTTIFHGLHSYRP